MEYRGLWVAVVAALMVSAVFPWIGVVSADVSSSLDDRSIGGGVDARQIEEFPVRHRDPDNFSERGDLGQVQAWLSGSLGDQLGGSVLELSQGEYESARALIGDRYNEDLDKYVDVAGETESESDDEGAERFRDTRDNQEELIDDVREYREKLREYNSARRDGDEEEARRKARDLRRSYRNISSSVEEITTDLGFLSRNTSADMDRTIEVLGELESNITRSQSEVLRETFTSTDLSISVDSGSASFLEPVTVSGSLLDEDGDGLGGREVVLMVGDDLHIVDTASDGGYRFNYRPVTAPVGSTSLTVRFTPRVTSRYIGSSESVEIDIVQVEADLSIDGYPDSVSYGERVGVTGSVSVEGGVVSDVPVLISIGGRALGRDSTDRDGGYRFDSRLPSGVSPGEQRLSVSLPLDGRAIDSSTESVSVSVESTSTDLSIDAEQSMDELVVSGELVTGDGVGVGGESVEVLVDGEVVGSVRTESEGGYVFRGDLSGFGSGGVNSSVVNVSVIYDGRGNLEPSGASTMIELMGIGGGGGGDRSSSGDGGDGSSMGFVYLLGVLSIFVFVLVGGYILISRAGETETGEVIVEEDESIDMASDDDEIRDVSLGEAAKKRLESGDLDEAVEISYREARNTISMRSGLDDVGTHWEFFNACSENGLPEEDVEDFRKLTEWYEFAAFAPTDISKNDAEEALGVLDELVSGQT